MSDPHDGIRKTAILIDSLDQPTAEVLLGQISLELAAQVRAAAVDLGEVDPHEREQVLAEFLDAGWRPAPEPPEHATPESKERDEALPGPFAADPAPALVPALDRPHEVEPRSPLIEASAAALAHSLAREHAQTICLVVAHLPPRQAADLLQRLPPARQAEVLRRLAQLEATPPEVLDDLGEACQPRVCSAPSGVPGDPGRTPQAEPGLPAASLPRSEDGFAAGRKPPPANAAEYQDRLTAGKAEPDESPPLTDFDDLVRLDDAALARVFSAAEPATVLLALSGANRDLIDRIVRHLPSAAGRTLRRQIETLGPTRLRDIESAQQQLAELAGQMCRDGLIHVPSRRRFTMAA